MNNYVFNQPPLVKGFNLNELLVFATLLLCLNSCKDTNETLHLTPDLQELIDERENEKKIIEDLNDNNVKITLIVDAKDLFDADQDDKETVNAYTTIEATGKRKLGKGCPKKDFTVPVNRASKMSWFIDESTSASVYNVKFDSIVYQKIAGSYNFFGESELKPSNGSERQIREDISNGWEGQQYEYFIYFNITNTENDEVKKFKVDPKLKMYAGDKLAEFYDE